MTYSDLSIRQYQEIRKVLEEKLNDLDTQIEILSILYKKSTDEILDLPVGKYRKMSDGIRFLLKAPEPFENRNYQKKIKINGHKYHVLTSANEMTAAQFIDYQSWLKAGADENLHNILSTFIIPVGKNYGKDYDVSAVASEIRDHLDIQTALDLAFFLRRWQRKSLTRTLRYSAAKAGLMSKTGPKQVRPMMKALKTKMMTMISRINGAG